MAGASNTAASSSSAGSASRSHQFERPSLRGMALVSPDVLINRPCKEMSGSRAGTAPHDDGSGPALAWRGRSVQDTREPGLDGIGALLGRRGAGHDRIDGGADG